MTNSTYDPQNENEFDKRKIMANNQGVIATCAANSTTNIDFDLTDDHLLIGLIVNAKGSNFTDTMTFQVYNKSNSTVVAQFGTNIYTNSDQEEKINERSTYPAKIFAGLTLRVVYQNTNVLTAVQVSINWRLQKIMI